ncbi:transposase [Leptospira sp. 'Mane']|uniref:transposase n=1 Tax=Leptospira sp. 'Mane' TaxID=3387407 RepID=UPI00398B7E63
MKSRKQYSSDFKKEAVKLLLTSGKSQMALSRELGITHGLLGRWKKEFDLETPENEDLKTSAEQRIKFLEKEVSQLKEQRDILKKAMGITLNH